MDVDILLENENLKNKINELEQELNDTRDQLNIYLLKNKTYYETHKEEHKKRVKEYKEKTNYNDTISSEKKKEYARTAYLNKKSKLINLEKKEEIL